MRWLVVIDPSQRDLFELLRDSLKPDAPFRVILDRRRGERRRGDRAVPGPERRGVDRRLQQRPAGALYFGAVIPATAAPPAPAPPAPPPQPVPSAPITHELVTAACQTCWDVLTFEMPRFPTPPARLEAEVIHDPGGANTQHYAEIQAFTISGRPLLVQRVQAVRRKHVPTDFDCPWDRRERGIRLPTQKDLP